MGRKSTPVFLPSATAATGGSAAAAQPARETKSSRSKPPVRSRQSSTRAKGMAVATIGHEPSSIDVSRDDIARLAYTLWEQRSGGSGSPEQDWLRAENELRSRLSSAA